MTKVIYLITIIIGCYLAGILAPWWSCAIVGFLAALVIRLSAKSSFWLAFAGVFALWFALMLWQDISNGSILSSQISNVFQGAPSLLLGFVASAIAALITGLSALSGNAIREYNKRS